LNGYGDSPSSTFRTSAIMRAMTLWPVCETELSQILSRSSGEI
jgi:hypothetical protein